MMSKRLAAGGAALALLAVAVVGCGQTQQGTATPVATEKTFTVKPGTATLRVGFLTGQLSGLNVVERVNEQTGEVVQAPRLRGTLKLKNGTTDQTARLLSATLEFRDADGKAIPLAAGREASSFTFYAYGGDRLDPGMESSRDFEVSFPAAALDGQRLADMQVEVTYIPDPYRAESVTVPVSLVR